MEDMGCIRPVELSVEEKQDLREQMTEAHSLICQAAISNFGNASNASQRKVGQTFRTSGELYLTPQQEEALLGLQAIEPRIISGYIRVAMDLSLAFHYSKDWEGTIGLHDYLQEASLVIVSCIYVYNGEQEFNTLVYRAIKNKLIDVDRRERRRSRGERELKKISSRVKGTMKREGMSFDSAISLLEKTSDLDLSDDKLDLCRRAVVAEVLDCGEGEFTHLDDRSGDSSLMRRAIAEASLTNEQRALLYNYFNEDKGYRARLAREEGITRQAIGERWKWIRKKVMKTYRELQSRQKAA